MKEGQLEEFLAQSPSSDFDTYSLWAISYLGSRAGKRLNPRPASNEQVVEQIWKSNFADGTGSLYGLWNLLNQFTLATPFYIGLFTAEQAAKQAVGQKTIHLHLRFSTDMLPIDENPPIRPSLRTLLTTLPNVDGLPRCFFQLGNLYTAESARSSLEATKATGWVVVVDADRAVYAIWNPNHSGIDIVAEDGIDPDWFKTRDVTSFFPGFS